MMTLPDISDMYPDQIQIGKLTLKSYGRKGSMAGEIYTISCSDDNLPLTQGVIQAALQAIV